MIFKYELNTAEMSTKQKSERKPEGIKVKLSVPERVNLPALLPPKGSLAGNALSNSLKKKIDFSQEEVRDFSLVYFGDGRYAYNPSKCRVKEFTFEPFEILHIQQGIRMNDLMENIANVNQDLAEKILAIRINPENK